MPFPIGKPSTGTLKGTLRVIVHQSTVRALSPQDIAKEKTAVLHNLHIATAARASVEHTVFFGSRGARSRRFACCVQ